MLTVFIRKILRALFIFDMNRKCPDGFGLRRWNELLDHTSVLRLLRRHRNPPDIAAKPKPFDTGSRQEEPVKTTCPAPSVALVPGSERTKVRASGGLSCNGTYDR